MSNSEELNLVACALVGVRACLLAPLVLFLSAGMGCGWETVIWHAAWLIPLCRSSAVLALVARLRELFEEFGWCEALERLCLIFVLALIVNRCFVGAVGPGDTWQTTSRSTATEWSNILRADQTCWNRFAPSRESNQELPAFVWTVMMASALALLWSLRLPLFGLLINRLVLSVDKCRQGTLPGWLISVMLAGSTLVCARVMTETEMRLLVISAVVMAGIAPIRALNLFAAGTRIAPAVNSLRDGLAHAGSVFVFVVISWPHVVVNRTLRLLLERPTILTVATPDEHSSPTHNPATQGHPGARPAAH